MQLKNLIVHVALIGACVAAPSRQQKRDDADILDGVISNLTAVLDKLDTEIKALTNTTDTIQSIAYGTYDISAALTSASASLAALAGPLPASSLLARGPAASSLRDGANAVLAGIAGARPIFVKLNYVRDLVEALGRIRNETIALGEVVVAKVVPAAVGGGEEGSGAGVAVRVEVEGVAAGIEEAMEVITGNLTLWVPCDEDGFELCGFN